MVTPGLRALLRHALPVFVRLGRVDSRTELRRRERGLKPSRISIVGRSFAPLGPSKVTTSRLTVEFDAVENIVGPVAHAEVADPNHSTRRYDLS